MTQLNFGVGALWGTRTDITGVGADQFAILQDNAVELNFEVKELYSQYAFPVDIARGKGKITGKAKSARVFAALYADLFFGATAATGSETIAENEQGTVPAAPAYTITVGNSATYIADLGVYLAVGLTRFKRVVSPSATGQYSVNESTGVYTFSAADANKAVLLSYVYSLTTGFQIPITNYFMGFTPTFKATFYNQRNTQGSSGSLALILNQATSSRLTIPSRIDDYNMQEFDYMSFADGSNNIGTLYTTE